MNLKKYCEEIYMNHDVHGLFAKLKMVISFFYTKSLLGINPLIRNFIIFQLRVNTDLKYAQSCSHVISIENLAFSL